MHECTNSIVAVFDLDGTLLKRDSLLLLARSTRPRPQLVMPILRFFPYLLIHRLKLIDNQKLKSKFIKIFLAHHSYGALLNFAAAAFCEQLQHGLNPVALQRLRWHQDQGHWTVLVTASPEFYVQPLAKSLGFDQVLATQLQVKSDRLTGKFLRPNCYGPEKVRRLRASLGDLSQYTLYAYGDSRGDRELLQIATYPYYRKFQDPPAPYPRPGWERGLLWSLVLAAVLYLGIGFWTGAAEIGAALNRVPLGMIFALLGLIFATYVLRFFRWQGYLKHMGYRVPAWENFQIFLASFALTASPGKAGESVKSLLLKRYFNIPLAPTLAGLFCERFTDALSVGLLVGWGIAAIAEQQRWMVGGLVGLQLALIGVLQFPQTLERYCLGPFSQISRFRPLTNKLRSLLLSTSQLLRPKLLVGGTLIALIAWGLEGIGLYFIFQALGATAITPYEAVLIHTASGLIGALSLLPGGIGGMEAAAIGLSLFYGAGRTQAVTAIFLIRLMTLWFAVAIGVAMMLTIQTRVPPNLSETGT